VKLTRREFVFGVKRRLSSTKMTRVEWSMKSLDFVLIVMAMKAKEYVPKNCNDCPMVAQEEGGYYVLCAHYDEYVDHDCDTAVEKWPKCKVTKITVEEEE